MKKDFKEYLKRARIEFSDVARKYSVSEHNELRTAIDDILIAYDQAVEAASKSERYSFMAYLVNHCFLLLHRFFLLGCKFSNAFVGFITSPFNKTKQ